MTLFVTILAIAIVCEKVGQLFRVVTFCPRAKWKMKIDQNSSTTRLVSNIFSTLDNEFFEYSIFQMVNYVMMIAFSNNIIFVSSMDYKYIFFFKFILLF